MRDPVAEFLELEKQGTWGQFGGQMALAAGTVAAGALMNEAIIGIKGAVQKSQGFKSMMAYNPSLQKEDRVKVQSLYNTLHNVSPDLANDPVVANSWVKRMMYQDEYIDPRMLSDLAATQQRMGQSRGYGLDFANIAQEAVKSAISSGAAPFTPPRDSGRSMVKGSGGSFGPQQMKHQRP